MCLEGVDQPLLVLAACRDGLACDTEDDGAGDAVALRALAFDDMQDVLFAETVVFDTMFLQPFKAFLKGTKIILVAHCLDDVATGYDAHLWVKCLEHLHVGVVHTVEDDGVSFLKDVVFFCHVYAFSLQR